MNIALITSNNLRHKYFAKSICDRVNVSCIVFEDKMSELYSVEKKYFNSIPNNKEPYTIVIPPPNVTGVLHMGHMLNNTIQDI